MARRTKPKRFYVVTRTFRAKEDIFVVDTSAADAWDVALEVTDGYKVHDGWQDDLRFAGRYSRARRVDALDVPTGIVRMAIEDRAYPKSDELERAIEIWNYRGIRYEVEEHQVATPRKALAAVAGVSS